MVLVNPNFNDARTWRTVREKNIIYAYE